MRKFESAQTVYMWEKCIDSKSLYSTVFCCELKTALKIKPMLSRIDWEQIMHV